MHYVEERDKARAADPPTNESTFAEAFYHAAVEDQATKLLAQVNAVDANTDRWILRLRSDYENLDLYPVPGALRQAWRQMMQDM